MPSHKSKWFIKEGEPRRGSCEEPEMGMWKGAPWRPASSQQPACPLKSRACGSGPPPTMGLQWPAHVQGVSWRHLHYCLHQQDIGGLSAGLRWLTSTAQDSVNGSSEVLAGPLSIINNVSISHSRSLIKVILRHLSGLLQWSCALLWSFPVLSSAYPRSCLPPPSSPF